MEDKAKKTPKKKPFVPMEMAKVPLDPQQAVLSCCEQPERGELGGVSWQCWTGECYSVDEEFVAS